MRFAFIGAVSFVFALSVFLLPDKGLAQDSQLECKPLHDIVNETDGARRYGRTICADVVALDQMLVYNRFGSFNPYGMMYALRRDVVPVTREPEAIDASACDRLTGTEAFGEGLVAGEVRLKDCKRPRPMVLRANAGDILHLRLTNLLRPKPPGLSETFCKTADTDRRHGDDYAFARRWVSEGPSDVVAHGEALCEPANGSPQPDIDGNWTLTRGLNFAIQGLHAFGIDGSGNVTDAPRACLGLAAIAPDEAIDCYYRIDREGPFFMASTAAPSGGQGDGGSLTHGLFGAVVAQQTGTSWYRSQVSAAAFAAVWQAAGQGVRHAVASIGDLTAYETEIDGEPVLNMLKALDGDTYELVHSDLNAIVHRANDPETEADDGIGFREFSVFFHDELKTFYTRNFEELGDFGAGQLAGVRDGFAINYGASGMGDMLLANRKGIGPAANCQECLYEEFFLTSWANGDPALLEQFSDDPSNVHNSYLNDPVVFRNFHAGPKETHVFHLHAHQWFAGNDEGRGSYLDSQTVAPQQGFSYNIYGGGMEVYHRGENGEDGWYETLGSGNRNRTPGDSIFHCHLYPHFAQGMWELWRVHDTLEDGTRKLPDGQWEPALSLAEMDQATRAMKRPGSVDRETGRWIEPEASLDRTQLGTPVPALVPLPGEAWPLLPTYPEEPAILTAEAVVKAEPVDQVATFPGYPFYIAAEPGHRPPQAPMDLARALDGMNVTDDYLDGGLPRHLVTDTAARAWPFEVPALAPLSGVASLADAENSATQLGREAQQSQIVAMALALGDLTMKLKEAELELLDYDGEPIERTGMGFHHDGTVSGTPLDLRDAEGAVTGFSGSDGAYGSIGVNAKLFAVNGAPAKPGAPFADPCGAPDALATVRRETANLYRVETGAALFQLNYAAPGTPLSPTPAAIAATDNEVSNWVQYHRTDLHPSGRPILFYIDGTGTAQEVGAPALMDEEDPFLLGTGARFISDPAVVGFRRFEASAVQVDMITNRAGWHDPQARINVLTDRSDSYKQGGGRISPKVTASEEPFFFRALSGECIEFRHTNELPKDLELDDFQVKTPTDTIGQHIHLVKFDVTASDGSGNGFNYEDGTMAPDEIAARICAAKNTATAADIVGARLPGELKIREFPGLCSQDSAGHWKVSDSFYTKIWRLPLSEYRDLFQTTTQRWFADPILSATRAPGDTGGVGLHDRTLRTVFSHDHFGPSSIQQHGFYTALVIEPQSAQVCDPETTSVNGTDCTDPRVDRRLVHATEADIGARKLIVEQLPLDPESPSYREFALSIADFAVLYDPRNSISEDELLSSFPALGTDSGGAASDYTKGIATLYCEALYAGGNQPRNMHEICGSALAQSGTTWSGEPGDLPPAWLAAGRPGDTAAHSAALAGNLLATPDGQAKIAELRAHLVGWRRMAAGYDAADPRGRLASPVAPPARPESISVDHHDPYLINYRGEPVPLRIGRSSRSGDDCALKPLWHWEAALLTGVTERCEISRQRNGRDGDLANVFLSRVHGDPVTPILEAYEGDPVLVRLIQGAQEVQHTFNLDGYNWPRNIDQSFPSDAPILNDVSARMTLAKACEDNPMLPAGLRFAIAGRPEYYQKWMLDGPSGFTDPDDIAFWKAFEAQAAQCFNTEGRIVAQEIGISEHFEFRAAYLHDNNLEAVAEDVLSGRATNDDVGRFAEACVRLRRPSDTLMHFGSQDAIWNGAWGLLRVSARRKLALPPWCQPRLLNPILEDLQRIAPEQRFEPIAPDLRERLTQLFDEAAVIERPIERPPVIVPDRPVPSLPDLPRPQVPELFPRLELQPDIRLADPVDAEDEATLAPMLRTPPAAILRDREGAATLLDAQLITTDLPDVTGRGDIAPRLVPLEEAERGADDALRSLPGQDGSAALERFVRPQLSSELRREFEGVARLPDSLIYPWRPRRKIPPYELVADCRPNAPFVYTAIVAIESELVFRNQTETGEPGTSYSRGLSDRNGLFFAIVDPRRLLNPRAPQSVSAADIDKRSNWTSIPLSRILTAIRDTYDRPEPMVLTVNAGDCVKVTMLNALRSTGRGIPGLRDVPGDAGMPPITSLDADRNWDFAGTPHDAPIQANTSDRADLMPSARLAVSLPLPIMNRQSSLARPLGVSPVWSLAGIPASPNGNTALSILDPVYRLDRVRTAQIEQFEFYAGRVIARAGQSTTRRLLLSQNQGLFQQARAQIPVELEEVLTDPTTQLTLGQQLDTLQRATLRFDTRADEIIDRLEIPRAPIDRLPDLPLPRLRDAPLRELAPEALRALDRLEQQEGALATRPGLGADPVLPGPVLGIDLRGSVQRGDISLEAANRAILDLDLAQRDFREAVGRVDSFAIATLARYLDAEFIPYAFGALPLKSHSDMIGHPTHGLMGAVTVVPEAARIGNSRAPKRPFGTRTLIRDGCIRPAVDLNIGRNLSIGRGIDRFVKPVPSACNNFVIVPEKPTDAFDRIWVSTLITPGPDERRHRIRQFTLFWQDGLNLRDLATDDEHRAPLANEHIIANCEICDDSYDWGDRGVSHRSEPFHVRLRGENGNAAVIESHYNLNNFDFGREFFPLKPGEMSAAVEPPMPVLRAVEGEEIVIHVVHPGGRARQRAFTTTGQDYDDLFPGFGFPRGALLAPGKAITASLTQLAEPGCHLYSDGPLHTRSGGSWGLLDVVTADEFRRGLSRCEREDR